MGFPVLSLTDPKNDAEGGIDPLGLGVIAERLAGEMVPGVTQRMSRPRFVTTLCAGALLGEGMEPSRSGTPPSVAFEWLVVQALAEADGEDIRRVPGMLKAKSAIRDGVPLSPARYLKGPTIFGFTGVYRTLAVALDLIDDENHLLHAGEELILAWEKASGLDGFLDNQSDTAGGAFRRKLSRELETALTNDAADAPRGQLGARMRDVFRPDGITAAEADLMRTLIADGRGGTRGETFGLVGSDVVADALGNGGERVALRALAQSASSGLRATLEAIEAFEALAKPVHLAFEWIRHLSTKYPTEAIGVARFVAEAPDLSSRVRAAVDDLPRHFVGRSALERVGSAVADFNEVGDSASLFRAVLARHDRAQRDKPPEGKRPWFERMTNGDVVVRPLYRVPDPPEDRDVAVFPYRLASIAWFLADFGGAR